MADDVKLAANGKRRVTVREFKNNVLIDIREFYTDDSGESKPGKKVSVRQYRCWAQV